MENVIPALSQYTNLCYISEGFNQDMKAIERTCRQPGSSPWGLRFLCFS